jgi:hypothetical protein
MDKIELIKKAIDDADKMQSKHGHLTYDVPALSSLKLRNLMNNLGALGTRYLECGPHKGGLFCAAIRGNDNLLSAIAVDSFESDMDAIEPAKPVFLENVKRNMPLEMEFALFKSDCFTIPLWEIKNVVDVYLYDAGHSEQDQRMALTYYYPALADEFIFCVDDYDWEPVKKELKMGLKNAD